MRLYGVLEIQDKIVTGDDEEYFDSFLAEVADQLKDDFQVWANQIRTWKRTKSVPEREAIEQQLAARFNLPLDQVGQVIQNATKGNE